MVELAKVTLDLEAQRGADVEWKVAIEKAWLPGGGWLAIELPRKLPCANCHGGGCDACARSGAIPIEDGQVRVELPRRDGEAAFTLRLPGYGGVDPSGGPMRGHLLLTLEPSEHCSERVAFSSHESERLAERQMLMKRSLIVAVASIAAFLWILKISGWL